MRSWCLCTLAHCFLDALFIEYYYLPIKKINQNIETIRKKNCIYNQIKTQTRAKTKQGKKTKDDHQHL